MPDNKSEAGPNLPFPLTRKIVLLFSLAAAGFFLLLSWALTAFYRQQSFLSLFAGGEPLIEQIGVGLLLGVELAVYIALIVSRAGALSRLRTFLSEIISRVRPTKLDIVLVGIVAGISEEVFFRATLQPMLGIWLTSVLFVLAHLGVGSLNRAKLAFGAFVFSMSVLLGFTYEQVGLVAAIAAHAGYDVVFLLLIKRLLPTSEHPQVLAADPQ